MRVTGLRYLVSWSGDKGGSQEAQGQERLGRGQLGKADSLPGGANLLA